MCETRYYVTITGKEINFNSIVSKIHLRMHILIYGLARSPVPDSLPLRLDITFWKASHFLHKKGLL